MKKIIIAALLGALVGAGAVYAAGEKHPNLTEAHNLVLKAIDKIGAARKFNEDKLGGHAEKAQQLLTDAEKEIRMAVEAADKNEEEKKK